MIATALFIATVLFLAASFYLMSALQYLAPYRALIWHAWGAYIVAFAVASFVNLAALAYFIHRVFFLKDTGRKLAHFDRQIQAGEDWAAGAAEHWRGPR